LLTSPDAEKLVEKYTTLAETAWISKLAQTIIGLRFGWPGGIANGERKVIVVSGGLTGRIRRKYRLNSLLNPDAKTEEDAETKNRMKRRLCCTPASSRNSNKIFAAKERKEHRDRNLWSFFFAIFEFSCGQFNLVAAGRAAFSATLREP
jgi:hypothetical protein